MHDVQQIRNTVILGHGHSGKTTLAEALLFTAGAIGRLGKVDEGGAALDFEDEEVRRKISISAAFGHLSWQNCGVFLADTPGDDNFVNETKFAARMADSALLTVGGVLGVRSQTERFVEFVLERRLPCLICITKMDRERANFLETFNEIRQTFAKLNPAVLHLPIGSEKDFKGVVDVLNRRALIFRPDGTADIAEIPAELAAETAERRATLMEYVAETDDDLLEHFLEEGELSDEALITGFAAAVRQGKIAPVLPCSPLHNAGSSVVLDAIVGLLPAPEQRPPVIGTNPKT
ncbi:elongation factor G, partial [Desulfobulbus sp. F4]|nr:elongation factor G [Desulfobulbus sp. F4]